MAKNPFKRAQANIQALAHVTNADRNADFHVTQAGLDAITQNLLTSQAGLGRSLSGANARSLAAMQRISGKSSARLDRITKVGENIVSNRYGSAVASDPNLFAGTKRVAQASGKVSTGQVKAGELQAKGGNEAMDIIGAAAQGAASSAQYELGQALSYRAKNDAELIAQQRLALQQTKLQADLQRQQYMWEQKQAQKTAEKTQNGATRALISQTAPSVATYSQELSSWMADNPDGTWDEFKATLTLSQDDPAYATTVPVLARAFSYMSKNGYSQQDAIATAFSDLYGDLPGYNAERVTSLLTAGVNDAQQTDLVNSLTESGGFGNFGGFGGQYGVMTLIASLKSAGKWDTLDATTQARLMAAAKGGGGSLSAPDPTALLTGAGASAAQSYANGGLGGLLTGGVGSAASTVKK